MWGHSSVEWQRSRLELELSLSLLRDGAIPRVD